MPTSVRRPTAGRELLAATLDLPLVVGLGAAVLTRTHGRRQSVIVALSVSAVYVVVPTATLGGTVGQALAGLEVVDLRSGKRVGWPQSALRWAVGAGSGVLTSAAFRYRYRARRMRRTGEVRAEMDELAERHRDSPEQLEAEALALYRCSFSPTFVDAALVTAVLAARLIAVPSIRDRLTNSVVAVGRAHART